MSMKVLLAVLLSSTAAAAPAVAPPGFVLTTSTTRVSFFSRGKGVDSQRVERRIAELEVLLGQPLGRRVTYYRYADAQELAARTGHYAAGVTFASAGEVHSTEAFHDHELVHLVAGPLGDPGDFFQEGLAVAIGNHGRWRGRSVDRAARATSAATLLAMAQAFRHFDPLVAYPAAGSFMEHLIHTHGMARVTAFFRACRPRSDKAAAFADTFGRTLESEALSWRGARRTGRSAP
jgi:hypothetical protein